MRKIPATIVTGFLGAGKTSLIRHLIEHAGGRRLALVINEFGELGIDRELLLGCGMSGCSAEDVVELANGCICCTVADDFLPTLRALLDRAEPPDHIVIETSGLALPQPLVQAFNWPEVKSRVSVDGVVVVIDAAAVAAGRFADDPAALARQRAADSALDHDNPLEEVFSDQLACADLVILNKSDLLDPAARAMTRAELAARLRPAVKLIEASHGAIAPALLLGLDAAAEEDLANRPSHHAAGEEHDHDDFDSFVVECGPVADIASFMRQLGDTIAAHDILRLKGFLAVPGRELRQVVQGVGGRLQHYFDRPWESGEVRASRLVVIGRKGIDQAAIATAMQG
jgi:cobalamin biosynthesis protein CobW